MLPDPGLLRLRQEAAGEAFLGALTAARFHVDCDRRLVETLLDLPDQFLVEAVGLLNGHLPIYLDVDLDEPEMAGFAGPELVKAVH